MWWGWCFTAQNTSLIMALVLTLVPQRWQMAHHSLPPAPTLSQYCAPYLRNSTIAAVTSIPMVVGRISLRWMLESQSAAAAAAATTLGIGDLFAQRLVVSGIRDNNELWQNVDDRRPIGPGQNQSDPAKVI